VTRIVLGPFNRVEGDLELSLDLEGGRVQAAYVNSPLFRGFEQLLIGRAPLDALAIVPRICGICSVAQSAAAASALAEAMGVVPTRNGVLSRQLIQATENLADHLTHFYLFFMPDFARPAYASRPWHAAAAQRFTALRGTAAAEVLPARANFLKLMGFLAGRWPHTLAIQPGGSTRAITPGERVRLLALLREFRSFLEKRLFGDTLPAVAALASQDQLLAWAAGRSGDFPAFLGIAGDLGLDRIGRASDAFLSHGAYDLFPSGTWQRGATAPFDSLAIAEETGRAGWPTHCRAIRRKAKRSSTPTRPVPTPGARPRATPGRPSRLVPWPARSSPATRCWATWSPVTAAASWPASSPACSNWLSSCRPWRAGYRPCSRETPSAPTASCPTKPAAAAWSKQPAAASVTG
jgi:hypothetical protein